ncbi:hypothetical protein TSMEX_006477 [Taenia solium]|eukprot:TsM_000259600 transcript=TsM_000259600 gene=TsM_000259600
MAVKDPFVLIGHIPVANQRTPFINSHLREWPFSLSQRK